MKKMLYLRKQSLGQTKDNPSQLKIDMAETSQNCLSILMIHPQNTSFRIFLKEQC